MDGGRPRIALEDSDQQPERGLGSLHMRKWIFINTIGETGQMYIDFSHFSAIMKMRYIRNRSEQQQGGIEYE